MSATTSSDYNVGWATEPDGRGTISLLFSCVSTTLICTWSALHLNVLYREDPLRSILNIKLKYFLLALAAPEYFVACAIREWRSARDLTRTIKEISAVCLLS